MGTDDGERAKILERRKRFIALALAGGSVVHAAACACLEPSIDAGRLEADSGADGTEDAHAEEGDGEE